MKTASKTDAKEATILLVDDQPRNLAMVINFLEDYGYRVVISRDGKSAVERAKFVRPDLILLDVVMPEINGFETCRCLKSESLTKDIPVIFMTSLIDVEDKIKGFEVGGADYVPQPVHPKELIARVKTHLTIHSIKRELETQNDKLKTEATERKQAQKALKDAHDHLEQRVNQRTNQLARVNEKLEAELRERNEAEEALRKSEERFALVIRGIDVGIWDWNVKTNKVFFSTRWKTMLGYTESEIKNDFKEWESRIHPDDRQRFLSTLDSCLNGNITEFCSEHRLQHKDGTYRWIHSLGVSLQSATGTAYRMAGSNSDITEKKLAEKALLESEGRFRSIFENASAGIAIINKGKKILQANAAMCKFLGYSEAELCKLQPEQITHPEEIEESRRQIAGLLDDNSFKLNMEKRYIRKDKTVVWGHVSAVPFRFGSVHKDHLLALVQDITEKKQVERVLQKSEKFYKILSKISERFITPEDFNHKINLSLQDLGILLDVRNVYIFEFNDSGTQMVRTYGWGTERKVNNKEDFAFFDISNFPWWMETLKKNEVIVISDINDFPPAARGEKDYFRSKNINFLLSVPLFIDNELFGFFGAENPIVKEDWSDSEILLLNISAGIIARAYDSRNKRIELEHKMLQIAQTDRLASLGRLSAGLAHEINNPNNFISVNISILERYWADLLPAIRKLGKEDKNWKIGNQKPDTMINEMEEIIDDFKHASQRIEKIVKDFKEFSQLGNSNVKRLFSVKECVQKAHKIVKSAIRESAANVHIRIDPDLPLISGDHIKIEQVIINLLLNAASATHSDPEGFIQVRCRQKNKDCLRIIVADNGSGINEHDRNHIFEPFFSTKSESGGTGLGLSVSYGIIKEHRGAIHVLSNENNGTLFIIDLPVRHHDVQAILPLTLVVSEDKETKDFLKKIDEGEEREYMLVPDSLRINDTINDNEETEFVVLNLMTTGKETLEIIDKLKKIHPWVKYACVSNGTLSKKQEQTFKKRKIRLISNQTPVTMEHQAPFFDKIRTPQAGNFAYENTDNR